MSFKALKKGNNVCIDKDGNLLLVSANEPTPPTPATGDIITTYTGKALWGVFDPNTWSFVNWLSYDTVENILTGRSLIDELEHMLVLNGSYDYQSGYALAKPTLEWNWTNYGYYLTEIMDIQNYHGIFAFPNVDNNSVALPFTAILNGLGSSLTLTFDHLVDTYGLSDQFLLWTQAANDFSITSIPWMTITSGDSWANITTDSLIYQFYSDLGLDIISIINKFNNLGWTPSSISAMRFSHLTLNYPMLSFYGEASPMSAIVDLTLSFTDTLAGVSDGAFKAPHNLDVYINKLELPETYSQVFGGDHTGTYTLYVPNEMVAQYQASADWNADSIVGYNFE